MTGDVNHLMVIGKPIEPGRRAFGVRSHVLKEQPIPHLQTGRQEAALGDQINTITCWAPDGVFACFHASLAKIWVGCCGEDLSHRVLVVEDDVGEVSVGTVVQI